MASAPLWRPGFKSWFGPAGKPCGLDPTPWGSVRTSLTRTRLLGGVGGPPREGPRAQGRDGRGETLALPRFRRVCLWPDSAARAFETHLLSSLDRASRTRVGCGSGSSECGCECAVMVCTCDRRRAPGVTAPAPRRLAKSCLGLRPLGPGIRLSATSGLSPVLLRPWGNTLHFPIFQQMISKHSPSRPSPRAQP